MAKILFSMMKDARVVRLAQGGAVRLYVVPRGCGELLEELPGADEGSVVCVLLGRDERGAEVAHVGRFRSVAKQFRKAAEWWHTALIFVAPDGGLTPEDVRFLERVAVKRAWAYKQVRQRLMTCPAPVKRSPARAAELERMFMDMAVLAASQGCKVFVDSSAPFELPEVMVEEGASEVREAPATAGGARSYGGGEQPGADKRKTASDVRSRFEWEVANQGIEPWSPP